MTNSHIWRSVTRQAECWAGLSLVQEFAKQLPRNSSTRTVGVPGYLQALQAGGAQIAGTPLRLTGLVIGFGELVKSFDLSYDESELQRWLQMASQVEIAHRETIAWLRSRMPGYPQLPAPHLAPGTSLTTAEFTYRLSWKAQEQAQGLQLQDFPSGISRRLRANASQAHNLGQTARALASTLRSSEEWLRLGAARSALGSFDREALRGARARVKQRLSPGMIDAHEPRRALARHDYRCTVLEEELDVLTGQAREFAEAFGAADELVELAASDIFGQLAVYGSPVDLGRVAEIDLEPGAIQYASFTVPGDTWLEPGCLIRIDDSLIADTMQMVGGSFSFGSTSRTRVRARVLPETSSLW
ncbi:hypothetical protein AB0F77_15400 [Streptomyces sp. NPDC026672]|uniref:hypothetical protein n=1 Tax=unclassified Streptomyces TaxID=2593676 RepID=UPI0033DF08E9